MGLLLDSTRLFRLHLLLIGLLVGAHVTVAAVRVLTGHGNLHGITPLFDLDVEANVPTLLSAVALLGAAALFWVTGSATRRHGREYAAHWRGLAVVFVFLSLDEAAGFHEKLSTPLREALHLSGVLHYAWIVPYALMMAALAVVYARFVLSLDPVAKRHLVGAGVVFLAGAVGLEMVGGLIASSVTGNDLAFLAAVTCEETLEMLGIAMLIRGLVAYNERHFGLQAQGKALAVLAAPPALATREAWLTPNEALLILELRAQSRAGLPPAARAAVVEGRVPERRRASGEPGG
jgi:hypothetical protein